VSGRAARRILREHRLRRGSTEACALRAVALEIDEMRGYHGFQAGKDSETLFEFRRAKMQCAPASIRRRLICRLC
jgi:hypothetical protein